MSNSHYSLDREQTYPIRGTAKLLNAASAKYGGDWSSVPHTHNYVELFYISGGQGQFLIGDRLYPVRAGQLVLINPHVIHTEVSLNAQPLEYTVLGIGGIELGLTGTSNEQFSILDRSGDGELSACLRNILWEMESEQPGYGDICQAYMEIVLLRLMRTASLPLPTESRTASANHQCAAVRRYIDLHFKEPLTLDILAEEAHMNKFYLSHSFKREYGVSPINYVISRRIEESKHLLAETDFSLTAVAQMLGFSSLSYFSQVFRRAQGVTPMEFRRAAPGRRPKEP